jgi:hypothetical protein
MLFIESGVSNDRLYAVGPPFSPSEYALFVPSVVFQKTQSPPPCLLIALGAISAKMEKTEK